MPAAWAIPIALLLVALAVAVVVGAVRARRRVRRCEAQHRSLRGETIQCGLPVTHGGPHVGHERSGFDVEVISWPAAPRPSKSPSTQGLAQRRD